ncbi:leucine-rich repeat-containing G-protein coupled receptor 4-like [Mya arenaria]|uniref:leucine-rich repeat-containing G-protein coupled receptor 4-like n=1 Tax=Mya arenaria TaxID=6604 RepID=UPI0022E0F68D|nr:leucine-rich repeat-containing G-protein coupled receptor 4-like [Mya arenaria]
MISTAVKNSSEQIHTIYLLNNNFTYIPDDYFKSLHNLKHIWLEHNCIRNISDSAFRGLESSLTFLDLSDNQLTTVPSALRVLNHLETLNLQQNPISSFDPYAFKGVSKSVLELSIDLGLFSTWPEELSLLQNVSLIQLQEMNFSTVPDEAFSNWTQLHRFSLWGTRLEVIQRALCNVKSTFDLYLFFNTAIQSGTNLFQTCNKSSSSQPFFNRVVLNGSNLKRISNIITSFPEMTYLAITNNPLLGFISNEEVPDNSNLTILVLRNNSFNRFPEALQNLPNLKYLDLSYNHIQSLQRHDLDGMTQLRSIDLNNNPLQYVSGDAFNAAVLLSNIGFQSTNLTTIPQALSSAHSLRVIYFAESPIECSCSMLPWLDAWVQGLGNLYGNCENENTHLSDFITKQLPNCTY